jgi:hypothetical protein
MLSFDAVESVSPLLQQQQLPAQKIRLKVALPNPL